MSETQLLSSLMNSPTSSSMGSRPLGAPQQTQEEVDFTPNSSSGGGGGGSDGDHLKGIGSTGPSAGPQEHAGSVDFGIYGDNLLG